jgi:hypothetical protein
MTSVAKPDRYPVSKPNTAVEKMIDSFRAFIFASQWVRSGQLPEPISGLLEHAKS